MSRAIKVLVAIAAALMLVAVATPAMAGCNDRHIATGNIDPIVGTWHRRSAMDINDTVIINQDGSVGNHGIGEYGWGPSCKSTAEKVGNQYYMNTDCGALGKVQSLVTTYENDDHIPMLDIKAPNHIEPDTYERIGP